MKRRTPTEDLRLVATIGPCICRPPGAPHFIHCPHVNHQPGYAEVRIGL